MIFETLVIIKISKIWVEYACTAQGWCTGLSYVLGDRERSSNGREATVREANLYVEKCQK